jgi:hypothetical protein
MSLVTKLTEDIRREGLDVGPAQFAVFAASFSIVSPTQHFLSVELASLSRSTDLSASVQ